MTGHRTAQSRCPRLLPSRQATPRTMAVIRTPVLMQLPSSQARYAQWHHEQGCHNADQIVSRCSHLMVVRPCLTHVYVKMVAQDCRCVVRQAASRKRPSAAAGPRAQGRPLKRRAEHNAAVAALDAHQVEVAGHCYDSGPLSCTAMQHRCPLRVGQQCAAFTIVNGRTSRLLQSGRLNQFAWHPTLV